MPNTSAYEGRFARQAHSCTVVRVAHSGSELQLFLSAVHSVGRAMQSARQRTRWLIFVPNPPPISGLHF